MYIPESTDKNVTLIECTYTVPTNPTVDDGSTPKWWVGLQSTDGMGVLMKPQLTWQDSKWLINTEVLDYSKTPPVKVLSPTLVVVSGDEVVASVRSDTHPATGVYTLSIGRSGGPVSSQTFTAGVAETRAYAVMEHQPKNCEALPVEEQLTLHGVKVEVGGAPDAAHWKANLKNFPACSSESKLAGDNITFMWTV
jgi:hypothetical protein